jgi:hypothetical protein
MCLVNESHTQFTRASISITTYDSTYRVVSWQTRNRQQNVFMGGGGEETNKKRQKFRKSVTSHMN